MKGSGYLTYRNGVTIQGTAAMRGFEKAGDLYTDFSADFHHHLSSLAWVLTIGKESFQDATAGPTNQLYDTIWLEAKALLLGLQHARQRGVTHLKAYIDNDALYMRLTGQAKLSHPCPTTGKKEKQCQCTAQSAGIYRQIHRLLRQFAAVELWCCERESNQADSLASEKLFHLRWAKRNHANSE